MNNKRREKLRRVLSTLNDMSSELETICDEEQDAFFNLPESIRDSDRGNDMEEIIDTITDCKLDLDGVCAMLEDVIDKQRRVK